MVIIPTEKIDIIIETSAEQVIKEVKKIKPAIIESAKSYCQIISNEMNKIDFKQYNINIQQNTILPIEQLKDTFNMMNSAANNLAVSLMLARQELINLTTFLSTQAQGSIDTFWKTMQNVGTTVGIVADGLTIFNTIQEMVDLKTKLTTIATTAYQVATNIAAVATTAFGAALKFLTSPMGIVTIAIGAIIAIIVLLVTHWDEVSAALSAGWEWIKQVAVNVFGAIGEFISNIWTGITTWITNATNNIRNVITNVLNIIQAIWTRIWGGLSTVVSNIFNGIWNTIRNVINAILGGIEAMANGVISGVNMVISALNRLKFKMPDWLGGFSFGFNISLLARVNLPRLAHGGIAIGSTIANIGEGKYNEAIIPLGQSPEFRNMKQEIAEAVNQNANVRQMQNLTVKIGNNTIFEDAIDYINDKYRRTGKAVIQGGAY